MALSGAMSMMGGAPSPQGMALAQQQHQAQQPPMLPPAGMDARNGTSDCQVYFGLETNQEPMIEALAI